MLNKLLFLLGVLLLLSCHQGNSPIQQSESGESPAIFLPSLSINQDQTHPLVKVYRIAMGDILGNVQHQQAGVLQQEEPILFAGLVYGQPWTRDAAINVWNGFGLISPEVAKHTLLAQVEKNEQGEELIGGQYWDKIIWTVGAWYYYLYSGDTTFLARSYAISRRTMQILENTEFSEEPGLFRGPAVYGDGVAAYPDIYTQAEDSSLSGSYSGIFEWAALNPTRKNPEGFGMPMHALSTNAVYYEAYRLLDAMHRELDLPAETAYLAKAEQLKLSIQHQFWNEETGLYRYLQDPYGGCEYQESLGLAFCLLFGIADSARAESIFQHVMHSPAGIPCVYPGFARYQDEKSAGYGRHSGTVWPHIQGFWADAAMKYSQEAQFKLEFDALSRHALRDFQFVEIYHPESELPYGGLQEPLLEERTIWFCAERQTWSATAWLRMLWLDIMGMQFNPEGIRFSPRLPDGVNELSLRGLKYRNALLNIHIKGKGKRVADFRLNGVVRSEALLPSSVSGKIDLEIQLAE